MRSKQMLGKSDLIDSLSRDLARARDKRDALTSGVTTLTAQIAELEARLSAENDRRERERLASEIEAIKKQLKDTAGRFIPMITELRDATAAAAVVAPEAHELHGLLLAVAAEVDTAIAHLLCELDQRVQEVCSSQATLHLLPSLIEPPQPPKNNALLFRLPEWLPHKKQATKNVSAEDQCGVAA
jgi:chromosome segregation ATPase